MVHSPALTAIAPAAWLGATCDTRKPIYIIIIYNHSYSFPIDLQLGGKHFTRLVAPNPSLVMHGAHGYSRHEKAPSARKKARKYWVFCAYE
jgi:hypothetical protein